MCNVLYFYFLMAVMNLEYQHMRTLKCRNEELYPLMIAQYKVLAINQSENTRIILHPLPNNYAIF